MPRYTINQISGSHGGVSATARLDARRRARRRHPLALPPPRAGGARVPAGTVHLVPAARSAASASSAPTRSPRPRGADALELLLNLVPGGPGSHYLFGLAPRRDAPLHRSVGHLRRSTARPTPRPSSSPTARASRRSARCCIGRSRRRHAPAPPPPRAPTAPALRATSSPRSPRPRTLARRARAERALEAEVARRWVDADADRTPPLLHLRRRRRRAARCATCCAARGYERRAVQYEKW